MKKVTLVWTVTMSLWVCLFVGGATLLPSEVWKLLFSWQAPLGSGLVVIFATTITYVMSAGLALIAFGWEEPFNQYVRVMKWAESL